MLRPLAACALPALLAALYPGPAGAQNVTPWLEWLPGQDATSCPTASQFATKVEQRLGRSPESAANESGRRLVARIHREDDAATTWSAEVEVLDGAGRFVGRRTLSKSATGCAPVADALALVAALSLSYREPADHEAAPKAGATPAKIAEKPEQPAQPTAPTAAIASPIPSRPHGWDIGMDAGLVFSLGILPSLSPGVQARGRVSPPKGPVLHASATIWSSEDKAIDAAHSTTLRLWAVGLGGCWPPRSNGRVGLALCAGSNLGRLSASGIGMAPQTNQEQWFIDLEVGAQAEVRIFRRILLGVDLRLAIPLTRGRVAYSASGVQHEAWKTWPLATTGFLHGGYTFW